MQKSTVILSIIGSMLLLSSVASAEKSFSLEEEKTKLSNKVFNYYDSDKNKKLSFEEFTKFSSEMKQKEQEKQAVKIISSCDKDKNGTIELSEVPTNREMGKLFRQAGKDLSKLCSMPRMQLQMIDENNDSRVTKEEILDFFQHPLTRMFSEPIPMTPPEPSQEEELEMFKSRLEGCDKNEDGNITLVEATGLRCYLSSEDFLEYSNDVNGSFEIKSVTHPLKDREFNRMVERFDYCDKNQDKQLTLIEATSRKCRFMPSEIFIETDSDKNGLISLDEVKERSKKREESSLPKQPFKIMKDMPPELQVTMALGRCDSNKDKKLTKEEAKKCELALEIFTQYDYDKSDTIEENDIEMMEKLREFEMVDMNKDKTIDPKEFLERMGNRCQVF